MSNLENHLPHAGPQVPRLRVRLAWWFAIYMVGVLTAYLIVWPDPEDGTILTASDRFQGFLHWLVLFPIGIALLLIAFIPPSPTYNQIVSEAALLLSYGFYCLHLGATSFCRIQNRFRYLMIGLLVLVTLNVASCVHFSH